MIKQSLLDSLVGLTLTKAKKAIKTAGHKSMSVEDNVMLTLLARPNTVILWHKDNVVTSAIAGDGLELDPS